MAKSNKVRDKKSLKQVFKIIFFGLCPCCGNVKFIDIFLRVREKCLNCSYSLNYNDIGDAAIWFSMLVTSIIIASGALYIELFFKPSLWVHILIWVPTVLFLVFILLRFFKILFIYINYVKRE